MDHSVNKELIREIRTEVHSFFELTDVLLATPRNSKYFSIAETSANGSIFTGPLLHCLTVLHCGCRTKLHFN